jgi:hypothetical protein
MPLGRPRARWIAALCVSLTVLSAPVAGCSKEDAATKPSASSEDSASSENSASSEDSAQPKTPTTGTSGRQPTLGDYIKQNNITEAQVKPGQPGTPEIILPMLPGWQDLGSARPPYSYAAIVDTNPSYRNDPPSIVAVLSKLTGPIDPGQILTLAPNEIRNLPDFTGSDPLPGKFSNFESAQIGGTYVRDGKTRLIAQKTVVIPSVGGFYVLQLNADGLKEQGDALVEATAAIDKQATIKAP